MTIGTLLVDAPSPYVRRLTLNRPARMNAFDTEKRSPP